MLVYAKTSKNLLKLVSPVFQNTFCDLILFRICPENILLNIGQQPCFIKWTSNFMEKITKNSSTWKKKEYIYIFFFSLPENQQSVTLR